MELRWYQEKAVAEMMKAQGNSIAVLPTGSGKTVVIAEFIKQYKAPILILSHVREILGQNYATLTRYLDGDVHMFSAGWNMRSVGHVTVAGIQSVYRKPDLFSGVGLVLIDECHLVNSRNTGMYRQFLNQLSVPVIGLTATPFRLGQGYLHLGEQSLFDNICYDLSDKIPRLQKEGYLSYLKTKAPVEQLDTNGLHTVGGDFSQSEMDERYVDAEATWEVVQTFKQYSFKKWLVFCVNIKHAEMVAEMLGNIGMSAMPVHSKLSTEDRDFALDQFAKGEVKALVNVNVLTTGFDAPDVDCIVMLRPTKSASLYSQIIGRGLRTAEGKEACWVLDFAGNIERLGPINNLRIDKEGKLDQNGPAPEKVCPECRVHIPLSARICPECGADVAPPPTARLTSTASQAALVADAEPVRWWAVQKVMYSVHKKTNAPDSIKISYFCGARVFREWLCIEHRGRAAALAAYRIQNRWSGNPKPTTVKEFMKDHGRFQQPDQISVDTSGKYPQILDKKYFVEKRA